MVIGGSVEGVGKEDMRDAHLLCPIGEREGIVNRAGMTERNAWELCLVLGDPN